MRILKPGDTCPCCGMPIQTADPDALFVLSIIAAWFVKSERRTEPHDEK